MNSKILFRSLCFLIIFGFLFASGHLVNAQSGGAGIGIKPALFEETVNPGDVLTYELEVTNGGSSPMSYYLGKLMITGTDPNGQPVFGESADETGLRAVSWIKLPKGSFSVAGGGTKKVDVRIEIPRNAPPGGHFASVFVTSEPPPSDGKNYFIGVGYQIMSLINLRVRGDIREQALLTAFEAPYFNATSTIPFSYKVQNDGNVLIKPTGFIEVSNIWGKKISMVDVNENQASVFPGSSRDYEAIWRGEGFNFGMYKGALSLVFGEEGFKTITREVSFWILPLRETSIVAGLFLLFVVFPIVVMGVVLSRRREDVSVRRAYARRKISKLGLMFKTLMLASIIAAIILIFMLL